MERQHAYGSRPWLAHYGPEIPATVKYSPLCLPDFLQDSADQFPENPALVFRGYKITYAGLLSMVDGFAARLHDFGIKKGEVGAILLPNVIPCVAACYAMLKRGMVVCMCNPLHTDHELKRQLKDSGARILVTLDLLADRMIDLRPQTGIKEIIYTSLGDYLPFPQNLIFPLIGKRKKLSAQVKPADLVFRWKEITARPRNNPPAVHLSWNDEAMYQYTGGTTGFPKGVILTHGNLSVQVQQIEAWFPQFARGKETMLGALPFFHIFGLSVVMNFAIYKGWATILIPRPRPKFLIEAIDRFSPSFAPLVPTMYMGMLAHPRMDKIDFSRLKGCFSGSSSLPLQIIRDFEARTGAMIVEGYGLTEASPVTHANPFRPGACKPGSVGLPLPDTLCRIVDLDDHTTDVPVGEPGELLVKGPQVMKGYRLPDEETAHVLQQGWLHTGDVARMDKDGYFYIIDRIKDVIITGGQNVYPREIDEVLMEHEGIKDACAVGIPHPTRGETVKAFVVLKKSSGLSEEEILDFCRIRLAAYKLPVAIEFKKALPKNMVGKVLRRKLRDTET